MTESISNIIIELIHQELYNFLELIPFKMKEKEVDPSNAYIFTYLDTIAKEIQYIEYETLEAINTPVYQEPLIKLHMLQNTEVGELSKYLNLELILPLELCGQLKIKLDCLNKPSRQTYLQMLFDCVNEGLNYIRPFGLKGMPDPWSNYPRTLFGEAELRNVFEKLKVLIEKWANIRGGAYPSKEIWDDEEKLQTLREERMSILLCNDAKEEEPGWVDYDDEEVQTKIDIGEIVFDVLVNVTYLLLQNL